MINAIIFIIALIIGVIILLIDIHIIVNDWELFPYVLMISAVLYEVLAYGVIYITG